MKITVLVSLLFGFLFFGTSVFAKPLQIYGAYEQFNKDFESSYLFNENEWIMNNIYLFPKLENYPFINIGKDVKIDFPTHTTPAPVPEPATDVLLGLGLIILGITQRRLFRSV